MPIRLLALAWEELRQEWESEGDDERPPVLILVCKNTKLATVIYEWLAEGEGARRASRRPTSRSFGTRTARAYTIRVDSKVVAETEVEGAKSDETRWMRFTLDTVGKRDWPTRRPGPAGLSRRASRSWRGSSSGRSIRPGRDVRCIVSVGMLTEGWDCNTVTHIVGLRPFMSQLLCEQVVGRGLRRAKLRPDRGRASSRRRSRRSSACRSR